MSWRMPAETEPQERVWMAYPPLGSAVTGTQADAEEARRAWAAVAHAAVEFEPVSMVVDPADLAAARARLSAEIELVEAPLDDAWMRDIGPTFVLAEDGTVGAVDWVFNGWGRQEWARWDDDRHVAAVVAAESVAEVIPSELVNEGGGIVVDGLGTAFVTETVQLDPCRNPGLTRADVEAELARTIGVAKVIWLPRGLTRDAERLGTRGHADMLLAIPAPGRLLVHSQTDAGHPDHRVTAETLELLRETTDARGEPWQILELPAPRRLRDADGWVDLNYVNHLVLDGAVVACGFGDPADARATELLADAYPGRSIRVLDAGPIFSRGGGIHCITQNQPAGVTDRAASAASPRSNQGVR